MDYFFPARILDMVLRRFPFSCARVLFHDPHTDKDVIFAQGNTGSSTGEEVSVPFGSMHRMTAIGPAGLDKTLSFLGSSLGARMDASRSEVLLRPSPAAMPLQAIAESASSHYGDSQAPFATLCLLDTNSYVRSLCASFPLVNPECLRVDLLKLLAFLFEAAGCLYVSEDGAAIGLVCAQSPTDTELLQLQLGKSLRRFISSASASSLTVLRSRLFESPSREGMLRFCQEERAAAAS